jgi:hypothetical protein
MAARLGLQLHAIRSGVVMAQSYICAERRSSGFALNFQCRFERHGMAGRFSTAAGHSLKQRSRRTGYGGGPFLIEGVGRPTGLR